MNKMAVSDDDKPKPRLLLDERTGILGPISSPPQSPLLSEDSSMDLLSTENLDRSSPELWPEQIPGVSKFASLSMCHSNDKPEQQPEWLKDLDHEDISVLQGVTIENAFMLQKLSSCVGCFGSLTASTLIDKVKDLQNLAYQLGLETAKEMTRGRFLGILPKKKDIRR